MLKVRLTGHQIDGGNMYGGKSSSRFRYSRLDFLVSYTGYSSQPIFIEDFIISI